MNIKVLSKTNKSTGEKALPSEVENATNLKVISEYINFVRAASRAPIASTKDRSEVSGGGKKPWRQKGTGRARHGSSRSPIWVGGGVTFGPGSERNFWLNYPKKFRQYARFAIFNLFAKNEKVTLVEDLTTDIAKTKQAEELLQSLGFEGKISIIFSEQELGDSLAYRNLSYVKIMSKNHQDIVFLASSDHIIFTGKGYEEYFAKDEKNATDN